MQIQKIENSSPSALKKVIDQIVVYFLMAVGAFLAAFAIEVFFIPHSLIDGGIVGLAMICGTIFGTKTIPLFFCLFNFPFLFLAYRSIGKTFLVHMFIAVLLFMGSLFLIGHFVPWRFEGGESLEVIVIGGGILGVGLGLIIRVGGCLDGTEILGIILNRKMGFTVGQVVLFLNVFIFATAGIVFQDWHPAILSLITYIVVIKIMDGVIVGLDETKSAIIISSKSKLIAESIIKNLGLGLTVLYGRGGFSGAEQEILYVIVERLQLADLKELVFNEDPMAFLAIEDLHEVASGSQLYQNRSQTRIERIVTTILGKSRPSSGQKELSLTQTTQDTPK